MDFWERTKDRIKQQNTSQEAVAEAIGVSVRTFRGWMSRHIMPDGEQVFKIAQQLEVDAEWLVLGRLQRPGQTLSTSLPTELHREVAAMISDLHQNELLAIRNLLREFKKN